MFGWDSVIVVFEVALDVFEKRVLIWRNITCMSLHARENHIQCLHPRYAGTLHLLVHRRQDCDALLSRYLGKTQIPSRTARVGYDDAINEHGDFGVGSRHSGIATFGVGGSRSPSLFHFPVPLQFRAEELQIVSGKFRESLELFFQLRG